MKPTRHPDRFVDRHVGPDSRDIEEMLAVLGVRNLDELIDRTVPAAIRLQKPLDLPPGRSEFGLLREVEEIAAKNQVFRSYIGMGYSDTVTPPVIQRNILENPGWYTQYTPYQPEISQGRLEALLNYQTMVEDLTGLPVANASLLDEGTAAAEAMTMFHNVAPNAGNAFFIAQDCHPQTIEVVRTRALPFGIEIVVGDPATFDPGKQKIFGALLQYPAAYFATRNEYVRHMPGRIIGVSVDAQGHTALRMALQTREQHIRREKATSNICTAQALLAIIASMYAVYHGPRGLKGIAQHVHGLAVQLARGLVRLGYRLRHDQFFDTVAAQVEPAKTDAVLAAALAGKLNLRRIDAGTIGVSLDETTTAEDVRDVLAAFAGARTVQDVEGEESRIPAALARQSGYLAHPVFNTHHSETEMLRYMRLLESRDLSLTRSMIPLGSCTMKLNATAEMLPITWPAFSRLHPFAPRSQAAGYAQIFQELEAMLAGITGFPGVSLQPNSGAQGEYAGLQVIKADHQSRGEAHRNVCLIPQSAHGTNPASAAMVNYRIVVVKTDENGNVDVKDLEAKAAQSAKNLAALMITYPSTHGVFEEDVRRICEIVHRHGGQVYMDGANMNAQVGLCRPGDFGPDVCHLNLHKTFCIPHGGGGPGMGPICVAKHLMPFLPGHPVVRTGGDKAIGAISAAPWGSASILLISWAYIKMMGASGLTQATKVAILNANYIAKRLDEHFPVLYRGRNGFVAHECIVDLRKVKRDAGIEVDDVAKRLMDYGFHAPTTSFPVIGTLMIEPTESEAKAELDRFCEAMIGIREEIRDIEAGTTPRDQNLLKGAPHTAEVLTADSWDRPYSRQRAAFPVAWVRERKFWPAVGRLNHVYGDRHLVCSCPPLESYR